MRRLIYFYEIQYKYAPGDRANAAAPSCIHTRMTNYKSAEVLQEYVKIHFSINTSRNDVCILFVLNKNEVANDARCEICTIIYDND